MFLLFLSWDLEFVWQIYHMIFSNAFLNFCNELCFYSYSYNSSFGHYPISSVLYVIVFVDFFFLSLPVIVLCAYLKISNTPTVYWCLYVCKQWKQSVSSWVLSDLLGNVRLCYTMHLLRCKNLASMCTLAIG